MDDNFAIQLFEGKRVRIVWDAEQEKYYFSVVDIVQVLTDSADGRKYWNKLKEEKGNTWLPLRRSRRQYPGADYA